MTDILRCRCGGEVRVVRLNAELLTLGHVRNPKDKHHVVRLAPAARKGVAASTEQPEVPSYEGIGTSPDPALASGGPRRARRVHAGSLSHPSEQRRRAAVPPANGSASAPSGGRS